MVLKAPARSTTIGFPLAESLKRSRYRIDVVAARVSLKRVKARNWHDKACELRRDVQSGS
jgi:hypothetical protein